VSFEEKSTWVSAVLFLVVPIAYFAMVLPKLATTPVADIDYQVPMLAAIGLTILLSIAGVIIVSISAPREAGKADQRDKDVARFGEYVGGNVMAGLAVITLLLTLAEAAYFWIANSLYFAFSVGAIVGAIVKIVVYRRGL
jgi:hypothetical protein